MDTENTIVPGTKLREVRAAAGLSRKDINIARVDIVKALAEALGCKIEDLLDK